MPRYLKFYYYLHLRYLMTWRLTTGNAFFKSQLVIVRILAEAFMDNPPRELARGHKTGINCKFVYF